jgi:hypothetical protein
MSYPYTGIQGYFEKGVQGTTGIFTKERRIGVGVTGPQASIHVQGEDGVQAFVSENGGITVNTPRDFNTLYNKVGGNNWNYFQFRKNGAAKWSLGVDSNEGFFLGNYTGISFDPAIIIALDRTFINLRYNLLAPSATFTGNINCVGIVSAAGFTGPGLNFGTGSTGATGIQGIPGINGATGPTGSGERGATGFPGPQGTTGVRGETGVSLPGFTGLQGPTGFMGPNGIQGMTGLRGFNGTQGATGIRGIQGSLGVTGLQGARGSTGVQGFRGLTGFQGITGLEGLAGLTGLQGLQGETGLHGLTGLDGPQGITGSVGLQGSTGVGAIYSRQSFSVETLTLASGQTEAVSINAAKGYVLYRITTTGACWVRIYTSSEARNSDVGRLEGTDPLPGSGVIAEVITTGAQSIPLTPSTIGFTENGSNLIPLAITNRGESASSIEITLTLLRIEL